MIRQAYFAAGCFWGTEKMFSLVEGVVKTECGFINSSEDNPSYAEVCEGKTGAREAVKVSFDDEKISLAKLLYLFFSVVDTTTKDQQGNDRGSQYQAGLYYEDDKTGLEMQEYIELEKLRHGKFFVEFKRAENFFPAEEKHQRYLEKNPGGYCHIGPASFELAKKLGSIGEIEDAKEYSEISPEDALRMKEENHSTVILDVRANSELSSGYIRDAVNIPLNRLPSIDSRLKNDNILVYCHSGRRSELACKFLIKQGFKRVYDLGGIIYWPFEKLNDL